MKNPLVIDGPPEFLRQDSEKVLLGALWVALVFWVGEAKAMCDAHDMGINGDALDDAKAYVEHDICRLASHTWEAAKFLHRVGDLTVKIRNNHLSRRDGMRGFCAIEANGADNLFNLGNVGCGECLCRWPALKELGRDGVDLGIGCLRGKKDRDGQAKRILVIEKALDGSVELIEPATDLDCTL